MSPRNGDTLCLVCGFEGDQRQFDQHRASGACGIEAARKAARNACACGHEAEIATLRRSNARLARLVVMMVDVVTEEMSADTDTPPATP